MSWLTGGGAAAALSVGAAVAAGLGWRGVIVLLAFFVSGSALTQLAGGPEGRRTARQVLANGGVAGVAALLEAWPAAAGALAAAAADTWATEIGAFSRTAPRLLTNGARVPAGTSGGVTWLGTAGGAAGAALHSGLAAALFGGAWRAGVVIGMAGVAGMLADSALGAACQGVYRCPACGTGWERRPPGGECHGPVRLARGVPWLDNDGVNLAATAAGAALAALAWRWL